MNDLYCWKNKFESCYYSKRLLEKVSEINNKLPFKDQIDLNEVKKAIYYAKKYHANQKRDSGEPFYTHPLEVAYNIVSYYPTTIVLVTSILHDTLEDTSLTKENIDIIFGTTIANNVEALSRIKPNLFNKTKYKISSIDLLKSISLQQNNDNLFLIKYFDRLHNMQTITAKLPEKKYAIVYETLKTFMSLSIYI